MVCYFTIPDDNKAEIEYENLKDHHLTLITDIPKVNYENTAFCVPMNNPSVDEKQTKVFFDLNLN